MAKAKITIVIEYEIESDYYPDCKTYQEMVNTDVKNLENGDILLYELADDFEIKGEVINA